MMVATIQTFHPAATAAVKAVMSRFGELQSVREYPHGTELTFACGDSPDLNAVDAALDSSDACGGFRGFWTGGPSFSESQWEAGR